MSYQGIDVSHYNKPINWELVKNQIDFAILKLGNIGDGNKFWLDETFELNYSECKKLGIPIGLYVYSYTNEITNIDDCAREVVNYLNNKDLDLPIYIDMEDKEIKPEGRNKLTQLVIEFNTIVEQAGHWAGVYANLDWWKNYLNKDELIPRYTSWIAHTDNTNNQNKYEGQYDMFQYSWEGHIEGCDGNNGDVDMNIMYRDLINEIAGTKPQPIPEPIPTPQKDINEIVEEVIAGWWGDKKSTPTRKQRLEEAGYNYDEVQARVNERLAEDDYYPSCDNSYNSIVDALNSIGVDSSYSNRKKLAVANGIYNYTGTATQNSQLLAKLKAGRLKRP